MSEARLKESKGMSNTEFMIVVISGECGEPCDWGGSQKSLQRY